MKKKLLFIFMVSIALCLYSCTKTCTCVNKTNDVKEIEVSPEEDCSMLSNTEVGVCS